MTEDRLVPNRRDRREGHKHPEMLASRPEVAAYLGIEPKTLAKWASKSIGPKYRRLEGGQTRYQWSDVEDWLKAQKVGGNAA